MEYLEPVFLRLAPVDIALVKFLFESYEGVAVVRTVDRRAAIIVALVSRDFLAVARAILVDLQTRIVIEEIPPPPQAGEDWLLRLLEDEPRMNTDDHGEKKRNMATDEHR
jgi:hypothetical protein